MPKMQILKLALHCAAVGGAFAALLQVGDAFGQGGGVTSQIPPGIARVITLGTRGGPTPSKARAQSSNLLIVNGEYYLIDAGDGVLRQLVQSGADFRKVGKIFITHDHDDHTGGLATLISVGWDLLRRQPIDIYGPPGTAALVEGTLQYLRINAEIRWAEGRRAPLTDVVVGHEIEPGLVYQDANVKVTAVENTHFHIPAGTPYAGKYKSYSYRFETPGRVVVFTGDTGPSDKVAELAQNADILVSEVGSADDVKQLLIKNGTWQNMSAEQQTDVMRHLTEEHLTPAEVGKLAARAKAGKVVLTHLLPSVNDNDDYARFIPEVRQFFSGDVVIAKDLMEF